MNRICLVYITASGKKEALAIGGKLVEKRLAACANIYERITSVYKWHGKLRKSREAALFVKTRTGLVPEIKRIVKKMHSYECPCVITLEAVDVIRGFADWIMKETGEGAS